MMDVTTYILCVLLPCLAAAAIALPHVLALKGTLDQVHFDAVGLAYVYASLAFFFLHFAFSNYIGRLISKFCPKRQSRAFQANHTRSRVVAAACIGLQYTTLLRSARQWIHLLASEPAFHSVLTENFDLAVPAVAVLAGLMLAALSTKVPTESVLMRFTTVYLIMLAAPVYIIFAGQYIASASEILPKIMQLFQSD